MRGGMEIGMFSVLQWDTVKVRISRKSRPIQIDLSFSR